VLFLVEKMLPWVLTRVSQLARWAGMHRLGLPRLRRFTVTAEARVSVGVAVEGAVLVTQKDENARYYGRPVSAHEILSGQVAPPRGAASLRAALGR